MRVQNSFAQNGEDLVLLGALSDIARGFYIDVGAMDPVRDSVTKVFYDNGWNGINVEPRSKGHHALETARPRDINLQIAVSNRPGSLVLYEVEPCSELSTSDEILAAEYAASGMKITACQVKCEPLADICAAHVRKDIHFLKIDVEGMEKSTLEGCDFNRFRPWLLAIEATKPCTEIPSHEEWEHLVFSAGYEFALFHHVNRYYVAREHSARLPLVQIPPALNAALRN